MPQTSLLVHVGALDKAGLLTRITGEKRVDELPRLMEDGIVAERQDVRMHFKGQETFGCHLAQMKPDHVRWTCTEGLGSAKGTTAACLLKGEGSDTILECDHDGWSEGHDAFATCNTLWGMLMSRLKEFAETGKPELAFN